MKSHQVAWLALAGLVSACVGLGVGCGSDESNDASAASGTGFCGNGVKESGEECDDANTSDADACTNTCQLAYCGDGIVSLDEECDDGNSNNSDGCTTACKEASCNLNGMIDPGEECDDGNMVNDDECTNVCTEPRCGDGIVQAGEDCDDGNNELDDTCPNDCMDPTSGGGEGGDPCVGQQTYAGMVTNSQNPTQSGSGIDAVWAYGGQIGIQAGNDMCAAIGADHVCSYKEVLEADGKGELASIAPNTEFWLHRVTESVPSLGGSGMSPPGPGARCNDWTYPTNHISDGEFGVFTPAAATPANASHIGNIDFFFDDDASYSGVASDGHQCNGVTQGAAGTAGCAGNCGGSVPKAILCCFPICN